MNVWVLDRGATFGELRAEGDKGLDPVGHASEWIDPESADWFATSNLELAQGPESAESAQTRPAELDHWFG
jgi:hypothetical protein